MRQELTIQQKFTHLRREVMPVHRKHPHYRYLDAAADWLESEAPASFDTLRLARSMGLDLQENGAAEGLMFVLSVLAQQPHAVIDTGFRIRMDDGAMMPAALVEAGGQDMVQYPETGQLLALTDPRVEPIFIVPGVPE